MSEETNGTNIGMRRIENDLFTALQKTQNNPEASPPYIFSYRVIAQYRSEGGLQTELERQAGAASDSETRLFALASPGVELPTNAVIQALQNPAHAGLDSAASEALAENVRRRLAWYYLPREYGVDAQILQQPEREDMRSPISSSRPVANHLGVSLNWRG
jgi:hypothetical protein